MKLWIAASAALVIAGSAFGFAAAQNDMGGQPPAGSSDSGQSQGGQYQGGHGGHGGHGGMLRQACMADVQKLCADVQMGGGRIFQCLREHQDQVSEGCKAAIANAHAHQGGQGG